MRTHPVFLRLEGRRCVVVGGDDAAAAKVRACVASGARVTVVATDTTPAMEAACLADGVTRQRRPYRDGDLAGAVLAYASTREPALVRALRAEAERERVLLNVIDDPEASSVFSSAVLTRGDLHVAIGTGGASPALAARLRRELEGRIGPEYGDYVAILGAVRGRLDDGAERVAVMRRLVDSELLDLVRRREYEAIDALLVRVAGEGCTLGRLAIGLRGEG